MVENRQIEEAIAFLLKLKEKIDPDKMQEPSFLMVLTGEQFVYQRNDGVLTITVMCLKY